MAKLGVVIGFVLVLSRIGMVLPGLVIYISSLLVLLIASRSNSLLSISHLHSIKLQVLDVGLLFVVSAFLLYSAYLSFVLCYGLVYFLVPFTVWVLCVPLLLSSHFSFAAIRLDWMVSLYAGFMVLLAVFELLFGRDFFPSRFSVAGVSQGLVATGTFFNENDFAAAIITLLPVVVYSAYSERPFRVLAILYFFSVAVLLAFSLSRAAQLVLMLFMLVYGLVYLWRAPAHRALLLLALFFCAAAIFAVAFYGQLIPRLLGIINILSFVLVDAHDRSGSIRIELMVTAWNLAVQYWYGFGGLPQYVAQATADFGPGLYDIHFFWAELFVVVGVVPATLLLVMYSLAVAGHAVRLLTASEHRPYSFMVVMMALAFFVTAHGASSTLKYAWVWLVLLISCHFPVSTIKKG